MQKCRWIIVTVLVISAVYAKADANTAATNVVARFMLALYSNDRAEYEKTIVPHPRSTDFLGKTELTTEQLAKVRDDVASMRLAQASPFRLGGVDVMPDGDGEYSAGTKATYMTQFRGTNLVIPVTKTAQGWRVDVRFWVAMRREYKETDPQVVAKRFLLFLIGRKRKELEEVSTTGSDLQMLLEGKAPFEDQYYCLAIEMPVVEAREGEGMLLPGNQVLRAKKSTPEHKWLVGLYGHHQLVFELLKEGDVWKTVPRDYLSAIGIGAPPATATEPSKRREGTGRGGRRGESEPTPKE